MIYQTRKEDFARFTSAEYFKKIVEMDNIGDFLNHLQANYLGLDAIVKENGETAKYDELLVDVRRVMNLLTINNVKPGSHVGILFNNGYSFVAASLGAMAYGCVAVLLPVHLDEKIVFGCSKKYVLGSLIYGDELSEKVALIKNEETLLLSASKVFNTEPLNLNRFTAIEGSKPACIIMTGGTSGRSKGALLSHEAVLRGTINGCFGIK